MKNAIIGLLIIFSTVLNAQETWKTTKVEDMHEKKWQYLVEQAQLSPSEIKLVKPIFLEYEKRVWNQHEKNREFFKSFSKIDKNSKPNYAEMNDQYAEIEYVQGQAFRNYHLKLRKLLKPETLFYYYKAERDYKRKLLQDLPNRPMRKRDNNNFQ